MKCYQLNAYKSYILYEYKEDLALNKPTRVDMP